MKSFISAAATVPLMLMAALNTAFATDCPTPPEGVVSTCKVITLSPAEEQALIGPNNILDTAQQGRPLDLGQVVTFFRNKIAQAPAGTVPAKPEPKSDTPPTPPPTPRPTTPPNATPIPPR